MSGIPPNTFARLGDRELACLYRALVGYLRSPESDVWFHQAEKSDPSYRLQAGATASHPVSGPDRPDINMIFRIGSQVQAELRRREPAAFDALLPAGMARVFESWPAFCRAVSAAGEIDEQNRGQRSSPIHEHPPFTK